MFPQPENQPGPITSSAPTDLQTHRTLSTHLCITSPQTIGPASPRSPETAANHPLLRRMQGPSGSCCGDLAHRPAPARILGLPHGSTSPERRPKVSHSMILSLVCRVRICLPTSQTPPCWRFCIPGELCWLVQVSAGIREASEGRRY